MKIRRSAAVRQPLRYLRLFAAAAATLLCACAQLPAQVASPSELETLMEQAAHSPDTQALEGVAATPAQQRFVLRVNALEQAIAGRPMVAGNKVTLLIDGPATHAAQLAAIAKARHHVHLTVYILTDDSVGHRYLEAFLAARKRGVKVRVMIDAVGANEAGQAFRKTLENAGVELQEFGPTNPAEDLDQWHLSHRNHRKLLVVDGRVAFTGGVNISDAYTTSPGASQTTAGWRDTHVRIDGPAVAEFQKLFLESWESLHGPVEASPYYYPKLAPAGHELVRAVSHSGKDIAMVMLSPLLGLASKPEPGDNEIYGSYLAAISQAQSRVWITQAYFIPNKAFLDELKRAAARGVDVRVLVPGYTDVQTMLNASRFYYDELVRAGVHVFEYTRSEAVLHAKTAVIDSVWSTVGSSNLDFRSFIHNDEANAIVIGQGFAAQMEAMFEHDLTTAREIKLEQWRDRGIRERMREAWSVMLKYWI